MDTLNYIEVKHIIDDVCLDSVSESQKEELLNGFMEILSRYENSFLLNLEENSEPLPFNNYQSANNQNPLINIYFYCPQARYSIPPLYEFRQPANAASGLNPYGYNLPALPQNTQPNYFAPQLAFHKKSKNLPKKSKKMPKEQKSHKSKHKGKTSSEKEILTFDYKGDYNDGILHFLKEKTGGNIYDNHTIDITSNSIKSVKSLSSPDKTYHPKNILDPNDETIYQCNTDMTDFWICFDFKDMQVEISSYLVQSTRYNDVGRVRNWVFEISNDNAKWEKIDEHSDSSELNDGLKTKVFNCRSSRFVRYCRFRHMGRIWSPKIRFGGELAGINYMELFGKIKLNARKK